MFPNKHKTKRNQVIYERPYTRQGAQRGGGGQKANLPRSSDLIKGAPKSTIEIKSEYLYVWGGQQKILPRARKII